MFQKCKESLRALDREKARSTLADALRASVVERTDKRLQDVEMWTSDDSSRMLHARLTMKRIEKDFKDHAIVWELITLSGEVLLSAEKKKAHKHVAAASNIVLALVAETTVIPDGAGARVNPEINVTVAPAARQARAKACPIAPELRLVMPRTESIAS